MEQWLFFSLGSGGNIIFLVPPGVRHLQFGVSSHFSSEFGFNKTFLQGTQQNLTRPGVNLKCRCLTPVVSRKKWNPKICFSWTQPLKLGFNPFTRIPEIWGVTPECTCLTKEQNETPIIFFNWLQNYNLNF